MVGDSVLPRLPWDGLGLPLTGAGSAREGLAKAGLGWEVGVEGLLADDGRPVRDHRLVVRRDTGAQLAVVGPSWRPVQNAVLADFCDSLARESGARFESVGVAKEGRVVWFVLALGGFDVAGDEMRSYIVVSNFHDGRRSMRACLTPIRVECANALPYAERRGSGVVAVRHDWTAHEHLDAARRVLANAADDLAGFRRRAESLAGRPMTDAQVSEFVEAMLPLPDGSEARHERIFATRESVRARILGEGVGLARPRILATRWGAIQGFIEHIDHGVRYRDEERRFGALVLGGSSLKRRALDWLCRN